MARLMAAAQVVILARRHWQRLDRTNAGGYSRSSGWPAGVEVA